jgi:Ca-activated chloride channel family protein
LILATLALARPQQANEKIKKNVEGIDIVMALDISDSMLIEDMQPVNRLESAKKTIKEFVEGRTSDKIGLVVFSGESYTRVPPTLDYKVLLSSLKAGQTTRKVKMGTAIGVALANSVARLRDSKAKSRVIVLLTDGENNAGTIDPLTALEIAKGYSIRVYTIGVGKDGDAQLPVYETDVMGQKIKRYQPIHSTINDALLGQLAKETGGKYYRATTTGGLKEVFNSIDKLEKSKIDVNRFTRYSELFPPYLAWALALLLSGYVLGRTVLRRGP